MNQQMRTQPAGELMYDLISKLGPEVVKFSVPRVGRDNKAVVELELANGQKALLRLDLIEEPEPEEAYCVRCKQTWQRPIGQHTDYCPPCREAMLENTRRANAAPRSW
jgi:hypothetical protein